MNGPATLLTAPNGRWAVAALHAADGVSADRLATDGERLAVVNGPALAKSGDQDGLARQILAWARSESRVGVVDRLGGSYNMVSIDPTHGAHAFTDFSGTWPLYWASAPGLVVISDRSTAVSHALGTGDWDAGALSWLIGHSNLFGEAVPAAGVRYLQPGLVLELAPGSTSPELVRSPAWVWPSAGVGDKGVDNLSADDWDRVTDDLVDNCRAIGGLRDEVVLHLSGGKDSRLCLALLKGAGLGDRVRSISSGDPWHPDVTCAADVARAAGVEHSIRGVRARSGETTGAALESALRAEADKGSIEFSDAQVEAFLSKGTSAAPTGPPGPDRSAERDWSRLRQAVFRYEAIVCPWDGASKPNRFSHLGIKGFGGELYRGSHAKQFAKASPATVEEMAEAFIDYHQHIDPLGALRPETEAFQKDWLKNWAYETSADVRLDLLPEKFYIDYRLGHWNGPLAQGKPRFLVLNPLLSCSAARAYFELSHSARASERLHYEVMRRTAPELLVVPFVRDCWSRSIRDESAVELPTGPYVSPKPLNPVYSVGSPVPPQGAARLRRRWRRRTRKAVRFVTRGESPHRGSTGRIVSTRGGHSRVTGRRVGYGKRALKTWQWSFLESQRDEIQALFDRAERETEMPSICDMDRLRMVAGAAEDIHVNIEGKALMSAISVALTLLDEGTPFHDESSG